MSNRGATRSFGHDNEITVTSLLSTQAKGAKALKAERAARVKAAADAAEQKLRAEEEQERELEKLANALGGRPSRHCGGSRPILPTQATRLVKDKKPKKKPKPQPPAAVAKENNGAKDAAAASETKGKGREEEGRQGRLQDQEGQEGLI